MIDNPLAGEAVQRRQGSHCHQPHQHGEGDQRHFFTDAAQLLDIAMTGAEPHRSGTEEQRGFEQAVVNQVIHAADKAQHHQRAVAGRHAGDEGAQPQQDNADILQGVIGQQALNVMLHQRIQSADKGGDHPQRQQHHAPPQRRHAAGQRNGQHAVQTNLHYHRGKQRGGRRAGPGVSLRRPAVQRDRPGQQGEPHQTRQPEQRVLHHIHRLKVDLRQLEGAVG